MADERGVDAIDRAILLLGCFDEDEDRQTLADLARRSGLYKSTILRITVSLIRGGYLIRDPDGRFRLGPSLWRLGSLYRKGFVLADQVRPELRRLSDATHETASFYIREGNTRVCLYRSEAQRAIRHSLAEGTQLSLKDGASAEVLLAWSSDDSVDRKAIREQGYAMSLGARDPEVGAISMPLIGRNGNLQGALAVSGLVTRFDEAKCAAILSELKISAVSLSEKIVETV